MTPILMSPFFWFAIAIMGWALWRLANWAASGGRLPLRGRRGSASGFAATGLSVQQFYHPGARQALEAQLEEAVRREEDDRGDPPTAGAGAPGQPRG